MRRIWWVSFLVGNVWMFFGSLSLVYLRKAKQLSRIVSNDTHWMRSNVKCGFSSTEYIKAFEVICMHSIAMVRSSVVLCSAESMLTHATENWIARLYKCSIAPNANEWARENVCVWQVNHWAVAFFLLNFLLNLITDERHLPLYNIKNCHISLFFSIYMTFGCGNKCKCLYRAYNVEPSIPQHDY